MQRDVGAEAGHLILHGRALGANLHASDLGKSGAQGGKESGFDRHFLLGLQGLTHAAPQPDGGEGFSGLVKLYGSVKCWQQGTEADVSEENGATWLEGLQSPFNHRG